MEHNAEQPKTPESKPDAKPDLKDDLKSMPLLEAVEGDQGLHRPKRDSIQFQ